MPWEHFNPDCPAPEAREERTSRSTAALPRRFRAFYDLSDHDLRKLGLERASLQMFIPVFRVRRDDLF